MSFAITYGLIYKNQEDQFVFWGTYQQMLLANQLANNIVHGIFCFLTHQLIDLGWSTNELLTYKSFRKLRSTNFHQIFFYRWFLRYQSQGLVIKSSQISYRLTLCLARSKIWPCPLQSMNYRNQYCNCRMYCTFEPHIGKVI